MKLRQVLIKGQRKLVRGPPNHAVRRCIAACLLLIVCDGLHKHLELLVNFTGPRLSKAAELRDAADLTVRIARSGKS